MEARIISLTTLIISCDVLTFLMSFLLAIKCMILLSFLVAVTYRKLFLQGLCSFNDTSITQLMEETSSAPDIETVLCLAK